MRRKRIKAVDSKYPTLRSLDTLGIKELQKLQAAFETYKTKQCLHELECNRIQSEYDRELAAALHRRSQLNNEEAALRSRERQLIESIQPLRVGLFRGLVSGARMVPYRADKYDVKASAAINEILSINSRLCEQRRHDWPSTPYMPRAPEDSTTLTFGGAKFVVLFKDLKEGQIENLIAEKLHARETEKAKLRELKERVAQSENERRSQAQKFRRDLHGQLRIVLGCPYCGGTLAESNVHFDHIYPIVKGGQSSSKNLVFVCGQCNIAKRDRTLRAFLKASGYSEQVVHERLELLGKDF